jgi:hypothetical protein
MRRLLLAVLMLTAACELCDLPATDGSEACIYIECKESWTGDAAQGETFCRMQAEQ